MVRGQGRALPQGASVEDQPMNMKRILIGGIAGGVAFWVLQFLLHSFVLAQRYQILQQAHLLRADPRVPFFAGAILVVDILVGMGLCWLYALARGPLGPGPTTALRLGLTVGLLSGVPAFVAHFAWTYIGGYVSLWWAIDTVAGFTLATLVGGWLYRD